MVPRRYKYCFGLAKTMSEQANKDYESGGKTHAFFTRYIFTRYIFFHIFTSKNRENTGMSFLVYGKTPKTI